MHFYLSILLSTLKLTSATSNDIRMLSNVLSLRCHDSANSSESDLKRSIVYNLRDLVHATEEYEKYDAKYKKMLDECQDLNSRNTVLESTGEDLKQNMILLGLDKKLKELDDLTADLQAIKQIEKEMADKYNAVVGQAKANYGVLQNNHMILTNDLSGLERDFNSGLMQLKTLKEAISNMNAELHNYDLKISTKRENAENALLIAGLRNRNAMLRLDREGRESKRQQSKELLAKLEKKLAMQTVPDRLRHEKAAYDVYLEKLGEHEDVVALYDEIKSIQEEFLLAKDLENVKSVELESLSKLSESLSKDLERHQRMTDAMVQCDEFPGSIASLQHHASRKCKELVETVQDVHHKKIRYGSMLESRQSLRNLVSGMLAFFSAGVTAYLLI